MTGADLRSEARLDAIELLLREILGVVLGRGAVLDRTRSLADALVREGVLSGDEQRRQHATEVRAALERLTT